MIILHETLLAQYQMVLLHRYKKKSLVQSTTEAKYRLYYCPQFGIAVF